MSSSIQLQRHLPRARRTSSFFNNAATRRMFCAGLLMMALLISWMPQPASAQSNGAIVSGRAVDAVSGQPLRGNAPPFANVTLFQCDASYFFCQFYNQGFLDSNGAFQFPTFSGLVLSAGSYRISITANGYNSRNYDFALIDNQVLNVGNIAVQALPVIGSISGKVREAVTGATLPGNQSPFANATLSRCDSGGSFCNFVASQNLDANGRYRFVPSDSSFFTLSPGIYQVAVSSQDHTSRTSEQFEVLEGQNYQVPQIKLLSTIPVRYSEVRPCGNLPAEGGSCRFSLRVENILRGSFAGAVWNIVETNVSFSQPSGEYQFQPARPLNIPSGESVVVSFVFPVPASVPDGRQICVDINTGQGADDFYFNVLRRVRVFCITKGLTGSATAGYSVMSDEDLQRLNRQQDRR